MTFTDNFVKRPVLATVISLLIFIVGIRAITMLELREYPETESSVVSVTTIYPGADSDLIQAFITVPLQRAISEAEGIDFISSTSSKGVSVIQAHMELNYDSHAAAAEIQSKVASQRNVLPAEALDPVIEARTAQGFGLLYIAYTSDELDPSQMSDFLVRRVTPKLQAIPGVAKAHLMGNQSFAMRVWLDPERMAALDVTPSDVTTAIRGNSFLAGVGQTESELVAINLSSTTNVSDEEAFRRLIIKSDKDTLVRLEDVARVELGARNYNLTTWFTGKPAVVIEIEATPGANPLSVSDDIRKVLPEIEAQLPESVTMSLIRDAGEEIRGSIDEVFQTLGESVVIVLIVVFLALGSWNAAIVPAISVPLSLVGAGFIMLIFGFSINLLTLLAMLLAIGLVVDDAIVVVENVHRHILEGKSKIDAALSGARELALPIISMTTTLLAVYAPIAFMGGLVGTLFTEFAFTLAGAVLISGILALVFSPMLSSKVLSASTQSHGFEAFIERLFTKLSIKYKGLLGDTLSYLPVTIVFASIVLISIPIMFLTSRNELIPYEDNGFLNIAASGPETATVEYTKAYAHQLIDVFESFPEYQHSFFMIGGGGTPGTIFGGFRLTDFEDRKRSSAEIQPELQQKVNGIAGLQVGVFTRSSLPGAMVGAPVQFVITTDQPYKQLDQVADQLIGAAFESGKFVFLNKSIKYALPNTRIVIDRDRAGDLGIDMQDIGMGLATLLGDGNVNRFSIAGRGYEVIPQVDKRFRSHQNMINSYHIRNDTNQLVPLSSLIDFELEIEPTKRTQFQQLNSLTVTGVMAPAVTLGEALKYLEDKAREIFPHEFGYDYLGQSRQYVQQGSALILTFFLSIVVIYLVLAAQFESWRDPFIILVSVPMSIAGALAFVTLGFASVNIYTQVGLITLIGLIAKNGILIVDFANRLQETRGLSKREAVEEASAIRLRPILMTTVAMIMAVIPLLLATGPGAVSRFQIGLVIATGLGIGTLFTLFVVPAFYVLLGRERQLVKVQDEVLA